MAISDNYNLFNLFLTKRVKIRVDNKDFEINLPSVKDLSLSDTINATYHIMTMSDKEVRKSLPIDHVENSLDFVNMIVFELGKYQEYSHTAQTIKEGLSFFIPNVVLDYKNKQLIVDNIIITKEV